MPASTASTPRGASKVKALVFPSEKKVPESKRHLLLRTLLYLILEREFGDRHSVGCDQFVYWNAADPKRCLAPDGFVRLGRPDDLFDTWKTWEWGAPELCVEIASRSDRPDPPWAGKLERYQELGTRELVRFDHKPPAGKRLRVWDRIDERLVERRVEGDRSPCLTLGLFWVTAPLPSDPEVPALRPARDPEGRDLLLTEEERATRRAEELEAELRRRSGET